MDKPFSDLSTEKFRVRLRPAALRIYDQLFPGCSVQDLREEGVNVHILDKTFGIDTLATFRSGQWISIQEKYRRYECLVDQRLRVRRDCPDFTQEFKNAAGTLYENDGEWFRLGAQLYFYGWSNAAQTDFEDWLILDIAKYKLLVERRGGLEKIGKLKNNSAHGRASFYAIPILELEESWVMRKESLIESEDPF